jgi:chemotaxis regulatin CheY-phosphate phosphatase CheZ
MSTWEHTMSLLKDAGDSIVKYGEIIMNKTEGYTKIAKLSLDVRKYDSDLEKLHIQMGEVMVQQLDNQQELSLTEDIQEFYQTVQELKEQKKSKLQEIELLKNEGSNKPPENPQS